MRKDFKDKIEQSFDFGDQGRQTEVCCLISCICGGVWAGSVCTCVCVQCVCSVWQGRVRKAGRWRVKCREYASLPFTDHPRDFPDFTGGTEDKWISQVNKPVLKTEKSI